MKNIFLLLIVVIIFFCLFGLENKTFSKKIDKVDIKDNTTLIILEKEVDLIHESDETDLFLDKLGHYESSNRYKITNRFGYMGKYQFSKSTLKSLGYHVSKNEFLNSPELQERAVLDLLSHNRNNLKKYIEFWDGKEIYGSVITESGILAAAHLAGAGNVRKFLKYGTEFKDGNGTKLTTYLTHFSGYNLKLD